MIFDDFSSRENANSEFRTTYDAIDSFCSAPRFVCFQNYYTPVICEVVSSMCVQVGREEERGRKNVEWKENKAKDNMKY